MPYINLATNIDVSKDKKNTLKSQFGDAITIMGKTENWLMVNISDCNSMYFKGDGSSPMAFVDVSVFGSLDSSKCETMTKKVCSIIKSTLDISPDNVYVKYSGANDWGWNNMNF